MPQSEAPPVREFYQLFEEFPADVRWMLKSVWEKVPAARREELLGLLPMLPGNKKDSLRRLLDMAQTHVQMAFGDKRQVVIVGPSNVGKSTLYNQLVQSESDQAEVSAVPGTTKVAQTADAGLFAIVDTPGADAVGAVGEQERWFAIQAAQTADFLIIMFDAIQGVKRTEQTLFRELTRLEKPYVVALNKMNLVGRRERDRVLAQAAVNLNLPAGHVIPLVAQTGENLHQVLLAIVKAEPALLAALGRAMPAYRARLARQAILRAGSTAAMIALTPIPLIDFIPLVAVQGTLILSIARIYKYRLTPARAKELAGALGVGYAGRMLFAELSKLGGVPGWILSAAIASATTVVLGYAAVLWFDKGEKLTAGATKQLIRVVADRLMARLKQRGKKRPSRQALGEEVSAALEEIDLEQPRGPDPETVAEQGQ